VAQFIVVALVAYLFSTYSKDWLKNVPVLKECQGDNSICYGALATYRIMFGLSALHGFLALLLIGVKNSSDFRSSVQDGWWPVKFMILVGITIAAFFIPNTFFVYYGWVMVVGSAIFILIQLVLLVEFAYQWNESWVLKMENEDGEGKTWFSLLLASTLFMICAAIALTGVMYHFFSGEGCNDNVAFTTVNLVVTIILCGLSLTPKVHEGRPSSGLLQSSVVMIFSTYLVYSAFMSNPNPHCNPFDWNQGTKAFTLIIGAIFTIVSVVYSTVRTASADLMGDGGIEQTPLVNEAANNPSEEEKEKLEDDEEEENTYNHTYFHLAFAMGSMYVGMLLTNWMTLTGIHHNVVVDYGQASYWVKLVSSWVTLLLYGWTLVGPVLLPDREWA